jgi:SAM-dependent methyltransferase
MTEPPRSASRSSPAYAGAIFLGAFLLFQVQPIIAKAILPWFGGAPSVWTTCMLFFQTLLLAGYAFAHGSAVALKPRVQGLLHLALLAAALFTLPLAPDPSGAPTGGASPLPAILALLARSVAATYFLLAASSPLLQAWSVAGGDRAPYRLYALSNAGSLLALLSYPVAIEPWMTTLQQERLWSLGFGVFVLLCGGAVFQLWRATPPGAAGPAAAPGPEEASPSIGRRLLWLALPACASTLLLAVTNQMCQEVAVVPFLWLIPLTLYLLSFILPFESDRWYSRSWGVPVLVLALIVMTSATGLGPRVGILYGVPVYSVGLFICCLFCHGELAQRRPAPRHLTMYYLLISLGGALGGVFVSLLAPLLFRGFDELYVGLLVCGALAAGIALRDPANIIAGRRFFNPMHLWLEAIVGLIGLAFGLRLLQRARPGLQELRNFYGILRVADLPSPDGKGTIRFLTHGGTRHGQQFMDPERRKIPTTYFAHSCGIGLLLDELAAEPPRRMGIIGLGAGILAAYGRPGDRIRFYELNPQVIEVARRDFTFLQDSSATIEIVPGDARLSLERETGDPPYDVFIVDAFSSDAIPVHLLTKQAFQLYARRLKPAGVLALHVSTRHLDLGPLVAALAESIGKAAWEIHTPEDAAKGILDARWIFVTSDRELLQRPRLRSAGHDPADGAPPPRLWTDDYSNLLQVLK